MSQVAQHVRPDNEPGHGSGRSNTRISSLDIDKAVFPVSALTIVVFVLGALLFPDRATQVFGGIRTWLTTQFDWLFLLTANFVLLFCLFIVISPLGKARIGGREAVPEYSSVSWFAMLFAASIGIGLMFFGVLEPVQHFLYPPLGINAADPETARALGIAAATFHWGLHGWAIYALVGLTLAFFSYNRGLPLTIRSAFYPLLGDRIWGWAGHLIDTLAVFTTVFGLATSLGLGANQVTGGLNYLFGIPATDLTRVVLIVLITAVATGSVLTGINVGIKRLSELNALLAVLLLVCIIGIGPTLYIWAGFFSGLGSYLTAIVPLSNWVGRQDTAFLHDWTIFYLAWWLSWAPFVGIFIARISRGRTVREFLICVLLLPTLFVLLWMSAFGGIAVHQYLTDGYTGVTDTVSAWIPELALFKMLEPLPLTGLLSVVALVLIVIFFVTSSDSGSLVVATIAAGGNFSVPVGRCLFWCVLEGLVAIALLLGGGLLSLQAAALAAGFPFTLVLIGMALTTWMELRREAL